MKMKTGSKFIALMLVILIGKLMNLSAQQEISIDNMHLRYDTDGKVIDAHDGRLVTFMELRMKIRMVLLLLIITIVTVRPTLKHGLSVGIFWIINR